MPDDLAEAMAEGIATHLHTMRDAAARIQVIEVHTVKQGPV